MHAGRSGYWPATTQSIGSCSMVGPGSESFPATPRAAPRKRTPRARPAGILLSIEEAERGRDRPEATLSPIIQDRGRCEPCLHESRIPFRCTPISRVNGWGVSRGRRPKGKRVRVRTERRSVGVLYSRTTPSIHRTLRSSTLSPLGISRVSVLSRPFSPLRRLSTLVTPGFHEPPLRRSAS
jgi:hypothetical protein